MNILIMNASTKLEVWALKRTLKELYLEYRTKQGSLDCGKTLDEYFHPELRLLADRINATAAELKRIDPEFPSSWKPL